MLATVMAATLQHVDEAFDVSINISVGVLQRIANAGLCREMDDHGKAVLSEKRFCCRAICEVELHKGEIGLAFQNVEARFLEFWIVIVIQAIETDDLSAGRQQPLRNMKPDKAGGSGDQYSVI